MALTARWKKSGSPTIPIEPFLARNKKAAARLDKAIDKLKALQQGGPEIHLYSMNRAGSVVAVVERLRAEGLS